MSCVSPFSYTNMVSALTTDDFVSQKTFSQSELGKMFTIDKTGYKKDGEINNDHLFTLFGKFSDEDCESVRSGAMERIECGSHVYEQVEAEFSQREVSHLRKGLFPPATDIIMEMNSSYMHYAGYFTGMYLWCVMIECGQDWKLILA